VAVDVRSSTDIEAAFQALTRERCNFVVVLSDLIFSTERRRIAALAIAARLPSMYGLREHADDGGLSQLWRCLARKLAPVSLFR
jgi:putative tryptophan/tyrosine transport system substrate-binding protein